MQVNANSTLEITIEAVSALKKANKKGKVLNIASAAGFFSYPTFSIYAASKATIIHFSKSIHEETKKYGIEVFVAAPGQIHTDFRKKASLGLSEKQKIFFGSFKARSKNFGTKKNLYKSTLPI